MLILYVTSPLSSITENYFFHQNSKHVRMYLKNIKAMI